MSKETVFVVFGALLLLQGCCCFPHSGTDSKSSESSEDVFEMKVSMFKDLSNYVDDVLKEGEKLFKEVLADVTAAEDKENEEINRRTKTLSDILDRTDQLKKSTTNKIQDSWKIASDMYDIVEEFDFSTKETPTAEDRLFGKYFEKHGVDEIDKDLENKFKDVLKSLEEQLDKFWNALGTEFLNDNPKTVEWHKKFKDETDSDKKLELLVEFFIL